MTTPENWFARCFKAEQLKVEGNEHFKAQRYAKALRLYAEAIELSEVADEEEVVEEGGAAAVQQRTNPNLHVYYTNRALCHIKLENFDLAVADCSKAMELKPDFPKGYYRRGVALAALGKFKEAVRDFEALAKIAPQDTNVRERLKSFEKQLQSEKEKQNFGELPFLSLGRAHTNSVNDSLLCGEDLGNSPSLPTIQIYEATDPSPHHAEGTPPRDPCEEASGSRTTYVTRFMII